MVVYRYYFIAIYIQIETIWKKKTKHKNNRNYYLLYSTIIKLLLFLTMLIFIETVSLIKTCITVYLVVFFVKRYKNKIHLSLLQALEDLT